MQKVTEQNVDPNFVEIARRAYKAYLENCDGKSWDGRPCPLWEKLTPAVRGHWCAAVIAAARDTYERASAEFRTSAKADAIRVRDLEHEVGELRSRLSARPSATDNVRAARSESVTPPAGVPATAPTPREPDKGNAPSGSTETHQNKSVDPQLTNPAGGSTSGSSK